MAMGGDGRRNGKLREMEGAKRRQGTTARPRRQLDGKGQRDGDSTTMEQYAFNVHIAMQ